MAYTNFGTGLNYVHDYSTGRRTMMDAARQKYMMEQQEKQDEFRQEQWEYRKQHDARQYANRITDQLLSIQARHDNLTPVYQEALDKDLEKYLTEVGNLTHDQDFINDPDKLNRLDQIKLEFSSHPSINLYKTTAASLADLEKDWQEGSISRSEYNKHRAEYQEIISGGRGADAAFEYQGQKPFNLHNFLGEMDAQGQRIAQGAHISTPGGGYYSAKLIGDLRGFVAQHYQKEKKALDKEFLEAVPDEKTRQKLYSDDPIKWLEEEYKTYSNIMEAQQAHQRIQQAKIRNNTQETEVKFEDTPFYKQIYSKQEGYIQDATAVIPHKSGSRDQVPVDYYTGGDMYFIDGKGELQRITAQSNQSIFVQNGSMNDVEFITVGGKKLAKIRLTTHESYYEDILKRKGISPVNPPGDPLPHAPSTPVGNQSLNLEMQELTDKDGNVFYLYSFDVMVPMKMDKESAGNYNELNYNYVEEEEEPTNTEQPEIGSGNAAPKKKN